MQPQHDGSAPRGTPQILAQSHPPPVDLSVGDIRLQIAAEWLQIAQRSQWRAYRKLPSLFTARCYAERGIAMASCLSICPLVTAQPSDHCEDDSYHQYQYGKEAFRKSHIVYPLPRVSSNHYDNSVLQLEFSISCDCRLTSFV